MESIQQFERRVRRLERLALPDPTSVLDRAIYDREMAIANHADMTYREALEHIIRVRHGGAD